MSDYKGWYAYLSVRWCSIYGEVQVSWHDARGTIKWFSLETIGMDGVDETR